MAAAGGTTSFCSKCREPFAYQEKILNSGGQSFHERCFVCVQCFQPFPEGLFYEFEGRKYCEYDFQTLYAPCCGGCGKFVIGRVIKALGQSWHPDCFRCINCDKSLADVGFVKMYGRPYCKPCHAELKDSGKHICQKCNLPIHGDHITYKYNIVHPHHFNCKQCAKPLTAQCKIRDDELYCLRCYDKLESAICGACRRPIEGRIIHALGKMWHPEHFVCAHCERPFDGRRHFERKGLAYCEQHYNMLFGDTCFYCTKIISGEACADMGKSWCTHHFRCKACEQPLSIKQKYLEYDMQPICKKCYERLPQELRRRLKALDEGTSLKKANIRDVRREDIPMLTAGTGTMGGTMRDGTMSGGAAHGASSSGSAASSSLPHSMHNRRLPEIPSDSADGAGASGSNWRPSIQADV
ncbi:LIM and senescent cell antigen-like-containing domain protein 1 [Sycon ciliatum]|uniref:LIM and senescent cell antigen-like-containing domain protein 1 n=1 Tax=Sycon ciliatum TaxID=27933 RepID=UPI0020ACC023|eukprot:scpid83024/ scgid7563/ LIM and senescent cell antigen-like-containing domain protein 2; Particularly interesting new Cys-His protein 2